MTKQQQKTIERKLTKLDQILDNIEETRAIQTDDPDTWDPDTLYNLVEELKAALALLTDQKSQQWDNYGDQIVEPGLCSLVDDYQSQSEKEE